jgi:hypothetical protein
VDAWLIAWLVFLTFRLFFSIFSTTLCTWLKLSYLSIVGIHQCVWTHFIHPMVIHLLCCVHDYEHIETHDIIRNTFIIIAWDVGFHLRQEQLHVLLSTTFNFSCWWIDIVLIKHDIRTLTNLIIASWTQVNLFPQSCKIQRFAICDATQAKERNYCNQHPTNQFLSLAIEIFGCLHKHVDVFLHNCVNAIWNLKGLNGPHLFTLVILKVLITLQKIQTSSIISRTIDVNLTTSQLPPLQNTPPITMTALLQVVNFWHINMTELPKAIDYGHREIFTPSLN